jgi:hypothetical protein
MRIALLLAALLAWVTSAPTDAPYELKGEAPGMTLEKFKANHPDADCQKRTARIDACFIYEGVSFAGVEALSNKSCKDAVVGDGRDYCLYQGINAEFFDGRMTRLMYGVAPGSMLTIVEALKKKYGKPYSEREGWVIWTNSVSTLTVASQKRKMRDGATQEVATVIMTYLNDKGSDKDI